MSGSSESVVRGLAHLALAVREADPVAERLIAAFGGVKGAEETVDGGRLRLVFVHLGPVTIELLEPRSADHTVTRFLESHGPGFHHASFEVTDIEAALERARQAGVPAAGEAPRAGAHGTRIGFLHPKSLFGVLLELCQSEEHPPSGH